MRRFINSDSVMMTGSTSLEGMNVFAYCGNNPVMYTDSTGQFPILIALGIIFGIGALSGIAGTFISDCVNFIITGEWTWSSWETYVGSAIGFGFGAVLIAAGMPTFGYALGSGLSTGLGMSLEKVTGTNDSRSWGEIGLLSAGSFALGAIIGYHAKGLRASLGSYEHVMKTQFTNMLRRGTNISLQTAAKSFAAMVIHRQLISGIVKGMYRGGKQWYEYFVYGDTEGLLYV